MDEIKIKSDSRDYPIYIGFNVGKSLDKLIKSKYSSVLIITDENVAKFYLEEIKSNLKGQRTFTKIIPPGEGSKNIGVYYEMQSYLIQSGLDRKSLIIALGGGVVGDLAGFVAATYMRGIDYIQIPTTVLAHDSSVGGKVAINHEHGKNMIGSFYPPRMVIFDTRYISTLPLREIRSGYAELLKEALIADKLFFEDLLKSSITSLMDEQIHEHIKKGILIKAAIVEKDEKENGLRKHLNLGHTLGHALEASIGYGKITHGEAVAIGLLFSLYVSERVFPVKLPFDSLLQWLIRNNYPLISQKTDINHLISLMKTDKKTINNSIQMVLLKKIGFPVVQSIRDEELVNYLKDFFDKIGNDIY